MLSYILLLGKISIFKKCFYVAPGAKSASCEIFRKETGAIGTISLVLGAILKVHDDEVPEMRVKIFKPPFERLVTSVQISRRPH